jgi:phospholipid-translocating ATPase
MVAILSLMSFLALFDLLFDSEVTLYFITILIMYNILLINLVGGAFVSHMMILSVVLLLIWIVMAAVFSDEPFVIIGCLIFLIAVMFLNGFTFYNREYHQREICNLERIANKEIKDTENLVSNLLPAHVYRKIRDPENTEAISENLEECTLLYADVCGFTKWCSDKLPIDVVSGLSELFANFDKLCVKYQSYKVCTIGDCYVVMSYNEPSNGSERGKKDIALECLGVV